MSTKCNYSGGTATNATESVATAQTNDNIADKKLKYISYNLEAEDLIFENEGLKWCDISMFIYKELMSHTNITNTNFKIKGRLVGFCQCFFSEYYIVKNVNNSRVRYEKRFGKKTDAVVRHETRKALLILAKYNLIEDKVDDIVTMVKKQVKAMDDEYAYIAEYIKETGLELGENETIKDAIIRYFKAKNIREEYKKMPKCDATESDIKETTVAEQKQEQLTETKPTIPKCSVGEEELENQVAEKTSNATAISMDEIRSMHYKLYSQERMLKEKVDINLAF